MEDSSDDQEGGDVPDVDHDSNDREERNDPEPPMEEDDDHLSFKDDDNTGLGVARQPVGKCSEGDDVIIVYLQISLLSIVVVLPHCKDSERGGSSVASSQMG